MTPAATHHPPEARKKIFRRVGDDLEKKEEWNGRVWAHFIERRLLVSAKALWGREGTAPIFTYQQTQLVNQ